MACRPFTTMLAALRAARAPTLPGALLACSLLAAVPAHAASDPAACGLRVVHAFVPDGADGTRPGDGLLLDARGHLLGVTTGGGSAGYGAVFDLALDGSETIVHDFAGGAADGADPTTAPTLAGDGRLYGTTQLGGLHGKGVVYRLEASGEASLLHVFSGADGAHPDAPLLEARDGALYGTTLQGGRHDQGVLFRITPAGVFEGLHEFGAPGDLRQPSGPLVQAGDDTILGTGAYGGALDSGGVFGYSPRDAQEHVLFSLREFSSCKLPSAGLARARDGSLLGTAYAGGPANAGCVFAAAPDGKPRLLLELRQTAHGTAPLSAPVQDARGRLLFTTSLGSMHGDGALLALDAAGGVTLLHAFGAADVSVPSGQLVLSPDGRIYGSAPYGGQHDAGGVFEAC
ncbi:choice-of-anchor tandem repeat GloVer-containing protein [Thiomonas sp. FB-6]|uniref:choice-of-anchor tandem repeat GloVer-containing protein n=1 Tax=Thiomonas sp. FB-6 TaxID=1158291 RepID=UPI00037CDE29|nr:choice-of-anchor tandem repeat GloVer-containing protein [Thiomonas sp. FB-6]